MIASLRSSSDALWASAPLSASLVLAVTTALACSASAERRRAAVAVPRANAAGPVIHVAPSGGADGAGSASDPLSLLGVARRTLTPGTTVLLHGGRYPVTADAVPRIAWQGTREQRIVLRSAPGEWAVIDGRLDVDGGAAFVTLRDFEVTRPKDDALADPSYWTRPAAERAADPRFRIGGSLIEVLASQSVELRHLYLHDNVSGGGVSLWNPARDALVYGCIVVRNGWDDSGRGHGHGAYVQNGWPKTTYGDSIKRFAHNVFALNFSSGAKSYGANPDVVGTHFERNVFFGNGLPSITNGSANYLAGTARGLLDDIVLRNNLFYQPESVTGDLGGTVYLGWGGDNKGRLEFTGNVVVGGGSSAVYADRWQQLTFTGNTLYDERQLVEIGVPVGPKPGWSWDGNTYYARSDAATMSGLPFKAWQERTAFDAQSRHVASRPSGVWSFVWPSNVDPHRALLVVYNWDRQDAVAVDPAPLLERGDEFTAASCLDPRGRVAGGRYSGGRVTLPVESQEHLGREFACYVLVRRR